MDDDTPSNKEKCLALFQSTVRKQVGGGRGGQDFQEWWSEGVCKSAFPKKQQKHWQKKIAQNFLKTFSKHQKLTKCFRTAGSVVFNSTYTSTQPTQLCPTLQPHGLLLTRLLSMGFFRQEYWNGLPFPSPGDLLNLGIKPGSRALQILYHLSHWGSPPLKKPRISLIPFCLS